MKSRLLFTAIIVIAFFSCNTGENVPKIPADFEFAQEMFMVRQEIRFADVPTGAVEYYWEFGENGTSNAKIPRFSFGEPGVYPVTLTIKAPGPETHTATRDVKIGQYYLYQLSIDRVQNDYVIAGEGETELYITVSRRMEEEEEIDRVEGVTADLNNLPVSFDLDGLKYDAGSEYSIVKVYDASDDSLVAVHDGAFSAFSDAEPTGDYDHEINSSNSLGSWMTLRYRKGE